MKKEDIETEAAVYEDSCHNPSIQRHFIDGAEWAMEEMIEKACKTYCRFCPHQCENYPHDDCQVQIELKNALEE